MDGTIASRLRCFGRSSRHSVWLYGGVRPTCIDMYAPADVAALAITHVS